MAIQLIIGKESEVFGERKPAAGGVRRRRAFTDLVEEAVLAEFDRISERGGVLGAMETGYQRGRIQDESMLYEHRKHDGSLPIVGVNPFVREIAAAPEVELARATTEKRLAASTGSTTSTPATPPRQQRPCAGCRTWRPARGTCSTS